MIGIGSPAFCFMPFARMLDDISKEFELWEILSEGEDRLQLIEGTFRDLQKSYSMRFQAHAPLSDVNIGSLLEPMRAAAVNEVKQTIVMCRKLEIPMVTMHPGFVHGIAFVDRKKAVLKTRESITEIARTAREMGVAISVENMPANVNATCTQAKELLEVIEGSGLGICFDMGHANTAGQLDDMLELVDRFSNVHLHNNEGQWDQHNRVDDGSADIGKVASVLKKSYRGNIIIEAIDLASGAESKRILTHLL